MIQYVSDLHLEFPQNREWLKANPIIPVTDTLIIAGDFIVLTREGKVEDVYQPFLDSLSSDFEQVFIIPGNHEYYNGFDMTHTSGEFRLKLRDNVFYVNNTTEIIDNHKFIFSTLWSHLPHNFPRYRFFDFSRCKYDKQLLTISAYNKLHEQANLYISREIEDNPRQHKLVIVTHHLPSFSLIDPMFFGSDLNAAFASMSDGLVHKSEARAWVYGHSHSHSLPKRMGSTTLYTNPLGYVQSENVSEFDSSKIILI